MHTGLKPGVNENTQLEPALFTLDVRPDKIFVGFREINYSFDDTYDSSSPAGHQRDYDLNDAFGSVAQDEFVHAKAAEENPADSGNELLVST